MVSGPGHGAIDDLGDLPPRGISPRQEGAIGVPRQDAVTAGRFHVAVEGLPVGTSLKCGPPAVVSGQPAAPTRILLTCPRVTFAPRPERAVGVAPQNPPMVRGFDIVIEGLAGGAHR
jgi:hypothetical protein